MEEPSRFLAHRIQRLFHTMHPPGRGPYTLQEVVDGLQAQSGVSMSVQYLHQLRAGKKDNPTWRHVRALARFFGVPAGYFFDDYPQAADVDEELDLLVKVRDSSASVVAGRLGDLSRPSARAFSALIDYVAGLESGQPPDPGEASGEPQESAATGDRDVQWPDDG